MTQEAAPTPAAVPAAPTPATRAGVRPRGRRPSLVVIVAVVGGGLALGGAVAHLTAPLRPAPAPVVTTLPGPNTFAPPALPPDAGALPFPGGPPGGPPDSGGPMPPSALPGGGMAAPPILFGGANPAAPPAGFGGPGGATPPGSAGAAPPGGAGAPSGAGASSGGAASLATAPAPAFVASVDGDTLTLTTATGPQRVRLAPGTRIQKQVTAERDELAPGQLVVVRGERQGGELVASTVELVGGGPPPGGPAR